MRKMKIGILTYPFNHNYGGYLQAYALLSVLKKHSFDVYLIDRKTNRKSFSFVEKTKGYINKYILNRPAIYSEKTRKDYFEYRGSAILPFVDSKIAPRTISLYSSEDLVKIEQYHFDAIIVGSDQIWRSSYLPNIEDFYLDFSKEWSIKRIAYAASFGTEEPEYTDDKREKCGILLKKFNAVSVREKSGVTLINEIYQWGISGVQTVLDPTMLLSPSDYFKLFPHLKYSKKRIFCYILDMDKKKKEYAKFIAQELGCSPYFFLPENRKEVLPSIEDFLSGIANSEFVLTDSFHGTVFSIIFNIPFRVFGNEMRGLARITDLLSMFDLSSCLVSNSSRLNHENISYKWDSVNQILNSEREKSLSFLLNNLS